MTTYLNNLINPNKYAPYSPQVSSGVNQGNGQQVPVSVQDGQVVFGQQQAAVGDRPGQALNSNTMAAFDPVKNNDDKQSFIDAVAMAQTLVAIPPDQKQAAWKHFATTLVQQNPKLGSMVDPDNPADDATIKSLADMGVKAGFNINSHIGKIPGGPDETRVLADPASYVRGQGGSDVPGVSAGASDYKDQKIEYVRRMTEAMTPPDQTAQVASKGAARVASKGAARVAPESGTSAGPFAATGATKKPGALEDADETRTGYSSGLGMLSQTAELRSILDKHPDVVGPNQGVMKLVRGAGSMADNLLGTSLVDKEKLAAQERIGSISSNMVLQQAEKMKGALSDRDIQFLKDSVPNLNMSATGQRQMLDYYDELAYRSIEKALFFDAYRQKAGTLEGVNTLWQNHIDSSSVVDRPLSNYMKQFKAVNPEASAQEAILYRLHQQQGF